MSRRVTPLRLCPVCGKPHPADNWEERIRDCQADQVLKETRRQILAQLPPAEQELRIKQWTASDKARGRLVAL